MIAFEWSWTARSAELGQEVPSVCSHLSMKRALLAPIGAGSSSISPKTSRASWMYRWRVFSGGREARCALRFNGV